MKKESITFSRSNDEWLKSMVDSKKYDSRTELINKLITQARLQQVHKNWICQKLESAEKSGFSTLTKNQILEESKLRLNN